MLENNEHNKIDKDVLLRIIKERNWNITRVASVLGIARSSLRDKMTQLGIRRPDRERIVSIEDMVNTKKDEFVKGNSKHSKERVLIVGDLHAPFVHRKYLDFVRQTYNEFLCNRVVFIGDVIDNHAMSYHEHNPDGLSAGYEVLQAQKALKPWGELFPDALVCIGNHDELLYRKAVTYGLPSSAFKGFNEIYKTPSSWNWKLSWTIDNVIYQHGTGTSGENAHRTRALKNRQSTVIGHVHSHAGVVYMASDKDMIFGMNVGCGIDIKSYAMIYGRDFPSRPTLGCGVVLEGSHAFFIPMDLGTKIRYV